MQCAQCQRPAYWLPVICAILLVASRPTHAEDQQKRFLEIPTENDTLTFDLKTVQFISPGRFTVISTRIDNPDVMKQQLKSLGILKSYCDRPDGKYPAPADLLQLGQPDLPIEQIEVKSRQTKASGMTYPFKMVSWKYPYVRLAHPAYLHCKQWGRSESELYMESHNLIANGLRTKELYDCKRGLSGSFMHDDDDLSKAFTAPVRKGTNGLAWYRAVCRAVTQEEPYLPE
ncbi:hypothetical protein V1294_005454 [Bradyrhizobium sp. AZCC 1678]